jgi:3-oxoadipate enol-lactonase
MPLFCAEFGVPGQPALVLLHGLGMAHRMWQPQCAALAADFHVLAPDLPGFARSATQGPFTLAGAAAGVAELLRSRAAGPAIVGGLSLGALVALQLARDAPDTISHLILSAPQVHPPAMLMAFQGWLFKLMPEKLLLASLATDLPTRDLALLQAAREDALQTGKPGLLEAMRAAAHADFRAGLSNVHRPTLVLCGSRDWPNLPAAREVARTIPGAELRIFAGAGHVLNLERPAEFTQAIDDFARRS